MPRTAETGTVWRMTTTAAHRRGGLLRHHDFRLLWAGETINKTGSAITTVALPLIAVTTLHVSPFTLGLLGAAAWLPWLLISLPAGAWVDQLPRRPVLQACNVTAMVAFGSIPVAAWFGALTITQLLVAAFITGAAAVFFRTAWQAYLPTILAPADRQDGNAKLQGSYAAADVAGPGLAGLLTQTVGAATALLVDAASFAVSAACLTRIRATETPPASRRENRALLSRIADGVRYVAADRHLRALALFAGTSNLILTAVEVLTVLFLIRTVGVTPGAVGLLLATMGVGGIAGAALTGWITARYGTARGLLIAELVSVPAALLIPATTTGPRLALFAAGNLILSAGIVVGSVIASAWRQTYCPPNMLGRVTAAMACLVYGTRPLGALAGGALAATIGIRPALWLLTAALWLPLLFLLHSPIRYERDLPTHQPAPMAARHRL